MKHSVRRFLPLALIAVIAFLSSCSGSKSGDSVISTIPADARIVFHTDVDALFKAAGAQFSDGGYALPESVTRLLARDESGTVEDVCIFLADNASTLDLHDSFVFAYEKPRGITLTLPVTDRKALDAYLGKRAQPVNDFKPFGSVDALWMFGALKVAVSDGQLWLTGDPDDLAYSLDKAKENHYGLLSTRRELLEESADITVIANQDSAPESGFSHITVNFRPAAIAMSADAYDAEGRNITVEDKISVLSTDFLRYAPEGSQLAFAIGQISDWDSVEKAIAAASGVIPTDQLMAVRMILPYLKSIDGTTSLSIAPAAGAQALGSSLSAWDFTVMTHMPQSATDQILSMIDTYATQAGISRTSDSEGNSCYRINDINLYVGAPDGYLAVSSRPLVGNANSSFTTDFLSKRLAWVIDIPYGSETMKAIGLPWGVNIVSSVETNTAEAVLRLNGTSTAPLEAIIDYVASLD
ncbi:MAG: hypothetical protein K2M04_07930 [Muribaculaceae bacterium]|nr:hypothetical protein [Muribaculaceae bacterium]